MHPGPINRGLEIESQVADGRNSVILEQVKNGLAVRMAVLFLVNQGAALEQQAKKPLGHRLICYNLCNRY
ncbi:MAG: hypothetical protein ACYST6_08590 [Planctomycetota bacterium]|jgi:aspartate carbamoyltransferase catalytic subunit